MLVRNRLIWLYTACLLFLVAGIFVLLKQNYYFYAYCAVPAALLCVSLALFSIDKLFLLISAATPLAINLRDMDIGLSLSLPTEPMLLGITVLFLIDKLYNGNYDLRIIKHPITLAIFFNLFWIFITTITSEMPVVSIKFLVARIWFVVCFYFLGIEIFKGIKNIHRFNWLHTASLLIVIGYTLVSHAKHGFDEDTANWIMYPFYNDHTAYAAVLAMFFPVMLHYVFDKGTLYYVRLIAVAVFLVLCIAITFSYTRAAWVSLVIAGGAFVALKLRVRLKMLLLFLGTIVGLFLLFRTDIIMALEKNRQDASDNFTEHIQSISNISSDASNLERLNRWNCAYKMFLERPIVGWGPGVYSFVYAPFQEANDKTIISTNFGTGGNAHSEYIGPLSESGVLGALSMIVLVFLIISTGFRLYFSLDDKRLRSLVTAILLGLITYFVHGVLNNFLDTDKASAPVWGFAAMLVAIDIYNRSGKPDSK